MARTLNFDWEKNALNACVTTPKSNIHILCSSNRPTFQTFACFTSRSSNSNSSSSSSYSRYQQAHNDHTTQYKAFPHLLLGKLVLLMLLLLLTYNDNFQNVHKHMGKKLTQNNTTAANTVHSWIAVSNEYTNPAKEFSFSLLILLFVHATAQYGHACKLSLFPKICVHFSARLIHRCVMCMHVCSVLSEIYFYRHFAKHFRSFVPFVRVFFSTQQNMCMRFLFGG